ncbi:UDP-N-acetylmuramoyl-L-alanyl-D-glutamate--2,6-diaminopimelate ligase, partial [bacterium]|nr:UDP-N-acetylmuramoyl-L-alanyl-D-glutamate--2,6-diaminopimelate ligase [bacterium]
HALAQERVAGVEFAGGVLTNVSQDHFDYHGTFEEYAAAKAQFFSKHLVLSGGYSVINGDDPMGEEFAKLSTGVTVVYGSSEEHHLVFAGEECTEAEISFDTVIKNGTWPENLAPNINSGRLRCPLTGRHNIYNCMAAAAVTMLEGLSFSQVAEGLESFAGVPGRLERVDNPQGVSVFVDYAHTPDALANVLSALDQIRPSGARIITVVGCGGDRDRLKRPKMGEAAQRGSDVLVVTSDNPRTEDPGAIIDEMFAGIDKAAGNVQREDDRRSAIRLALGMAKRGDIVLIAGKGHEDYQIIGEEKVHFSDVEEVKGYYELA